MSTRSAVTWVLGVFVLAALAAGDAAAPAADKAVPAPRVVPVGNTTQQLGTTRRAQRITTTFKVRNEGDAPLVLSDGFVIGCQCGKVVLPPPVPPGAEGEVSVVIDTTDLGGRTMLRAFARTNDPAEPGIAFQVEFDVQMMVAVQPGYMRYSYVLGEEQGTIVQTIWAKDREDFQVLTVRSPYPHLAVEWREARPEERLPQGRGRQWRLAATLLGDAPVGALRGTVDVTTNHDTDTIVRIPLSGFVRPQWSVTPAVLDFGEFPAAGGERRKRAYFDAFGSRGLRPLAVRTTVTWISATIRTVQERRRYDISFALPEVAPVGVFEGVLVIETASTDPKLKRIEVPMRGTVVESSTPSS